MASALRQELMHSESVESQSLTQAKVSSTHISSQTWLSSKSLQNYDFRVANRLIGHLAVLTDNLDPLAGRPGEKRPHQVKIE